MAPYQPGGQDWQEDIARRLDFMIDQITPEEFRWQDANYDRDSALGRELLFLIANNEWIRATAETIEITRSDTIDETIRVDIDLSRIQHEAFHDRPAGPIWLPVLIMPPLRGADQAGTHRRSRAEPDPFVALTVTDAKGDRQPTLPDSDVRHRIAAALAEIVVNIAAAHRPGADGRDFHATRDQRLVLSAAIYRLLRGEHVPTAIMSGEAPPRQGAGETRSRLGTARGGLFDLISAYPAASRDSAERGTSESDSWPARAPGSPGGEHAIRDDWSSSVRPHLRTRALQLLMAFSESAVVVVAAERTGMPSVLSVQAPSRTLYRLRPGRDRPTAAGARARWPGRWRLLRPRTWIWLLPRARLQVGLLFPSADADRLVQVNLPEGIALDPSRVREQRADLDIRTRCPIAVHQLAALAAQLAGGRFADQPALRQSLADLAGAKADAARAAMRDSSVGAAVGEPPLSRAETTEHTRRYRADLDELAEALRAIADGSAGAGQVSPADGADRASLDKPMRRRTQTDAVGPGVVMARARMIEDLSQRATPVEANVSLRVALSATGDISVARFAGRMSALLMLIVLGFFWYERLSGHGSGHISADVLAFVLTLFSAVQAGRIERPDSATLVGLLTSSGNVLIVALIFPTMLLAVALAFSLSLTWAIGACYACIAMQFCLQLVLLWLQRMRTPRPDGHEPAATWLADGIVLTTAAPDYSHYEILHSRWWRSTTADALLIGRPAFGYFVWQHDGSPMLNPLFEAAAMPEGRPRQAHQDARMLARIIAALTSQADTRRDEADLPDQDTGRPRQNADRLARQADPGLTDPDRAGPGRGPGEGPAFGDVPRSLLEQPEISNGLGLLRSGTVWQSMNFTVFRDKPATRWSSGATGDSSIEEVDLDPGRLAPIDEMPGYLTVFAGLNRAAGLPGIAAHPVTLVTQAAARARLTVLGIQLPVPPPTAGYIDLSWSQVTIGVRDGEVGAVADFLRDVHDVLLPATYAADLAHLAAGSPDLAPEPVVAVQTIGHGIPRILNPRPGQPNPGPALDSSASYHSIQASDLDVVATNCVPIGRIAEDPDEETWRLLGIAADWRAGVHGAILSAIDPTMQLAGLLTGILHGKAVALVVGHRPGGSVGLSEPHLASPGDQAHGGVTAYISQWLPRSRLGEAGEYPLLRISMRAPDQPGTIVALLRALRETLKQAAPGTLGQQDWNIWFARASLAAGGVARIEFTARLAVDKDQMARMRHPISAWDPSDFARFERLTLARASTQTLLPGHRDDSPDDRAMPVREGMVISVGRVQTPKLMTSPESGAGCALGADRVSGTAPEATPDPAAAATGSD